MYLLLLVHVPSKTPILWIYYFSSILVYVAMLHVLLPCTSPRTDHDSARRPPTDNQTLVPQYLHNQRGICAKVHHHQDAHLTPRHYTYIHSYYKRIARSLHHSTPHITANRKTPKQNNTPTSSYTHAGLKPATPNRLIHTSSSPHNPTSSHFSPKQLYHHQHQHPTSASPPSYLLRTRTPKPLSFHFHSFRSLSYSHPPYHP